MQLPHRHHHHHWKCLHCQCQAVSGHLRRLHQSELEFLPHGDNCAGFSRLDRRERLLEVSKGPWKWQSVCIPVVFTRYYSGPWKKNLGNLLFISKDFLLELFKVWIPNTEDFNSLPSLHLKYKTLKWPWNRPHQLKTLICDILKHSSD